MSIATELQNYNDGLLDAYAAVSAKGGTIPAQKNLANLPDAIDSISGGGSSVDPYITFSTDSGTNELSLANAATGLNLEYSYDTTTWTTWDLTTPLEFGGATKLYMRGTNNTLATSTSDYTQFAFSDNTVLVDCDGRISKLLIYDNEYYDYVMSESYCFYNLFKDCVALNSAPELSYANATSYCYQQMFQGCTSLTHVQQTLPAVSIGNSSYDSMFKGCTSLITAPMLPSLKLGSSSYNSMFDGCTSLLNVQNSLPASSVSTHVYGRMFAGCTSLVSAPDIAATSFSTYSCSEMFTGCTSLEETPNIDIQSVSNNTSYTFNAMFSGCTSLREMNINFNLTLSSTHSRLFRDMFKNCVALESAPNTLPSGQIGQEVYSSMFEGCTSITSTPTFDITGVSKNCCDGMFKRCSSLTTNNVTLSATTLAESCYASMFRETALSVAPELPATTLAKSCYSNMFYGCSNLTTAPELPATTLASSCYIYMFSHCTSLTTAPELPATTLITSCYSNMFAYCSSLTSAPELPAATLVSSCYSNMFLDCENLAYVKCLAENPSGLYTAAWLGNVADYGTFVKKTGITWESSAAGIPLYWTVEEV